MLILTTLIQIYIIYTCDYIQTIYFIFFKIINIFIFLYIFILFILYKLEKIYLFSFFILRKKKFSEKYSNIVIKSFTYFQFRIKYCWVGSFLIFQFLRKIILSISYLEINYNKFLGKIILSINYYNNKIFLVLFFSFNNKNDDNGYF